jgi:hypothetical protein
MPDDAGNFKGTMGTNLASAARAGFMKDFDFECRDGLV